MVKKTSSNSEIIFQRFINDAYQFLESKEKMFVLKKGIIPISHGNLDITKSKKSALSLIMESISNEKNYESLPKLCAIIFDFLLIDNVNNSEISYIIEPILYLIKYNIANFSFSDIKISQKIYQSIASSQPKNQKEIEVAKLLLEKINFAINFISKKDKSNLKNDNFLNLKKLTEEKNHKLREIEKIINDKKNFECRIQSDYKEPCGEVEIIKKEAADDIKEIKKNSYL